MTSAAFNNAQIRHIVATLRHIDELLVRAMQADTDIRSSAQTYPAIPPETDMALSGMREELYAALEAWAPGESASPGQLRWALQTALRLALIALEELDAKHLGHYGRVDPAGMGQLAETRKRLENRLEEIRATLEQPSPAARP